MQEPLALSVLLDEVRACTRCAGSLPHAPRPVVVADAGARILIAGQAPGRRVHRSGIPWDDPSGERLRAWLGVEPDVFYDPRRFALVPMGFCWPGSGRGGDLPPRPECRATWHPRLLPLLTAVRLRIIIGAHAHAWHLQVPPSTPVTATVAGWRAHAPAVFPLPHPSPRNTRWLRLNPWFAAEVLPALREAVVAALAS